jgi:hypothetical protein
MADPFTEMQRRGFSVTPIYWLPILVAFAGLANVHL